MTTTSTADPELIAMMDAVFAAHRDDHTEPTGEPVVLDRALWRRLDDLGLVRLTGPETSGGSGAGWQESSELLSAAVCHGVRLPLAEHDLLACWLLDAAGLPVDDAVRTVGVLTDGSASAVPWLGATDRVVVVWQTDDGYRLADLATNELTVEQGTNLIGEPRGAVRTDVGAWTGEPVAAELVTVLARKSAMVRAIQVVAALDRAVARSVEHVTSRVQFGRPLAKFQAVQNLIADAAAEAALARAATEGALHVAVETDWSSDDLDFLIATARSCAGHAASVVTRNAHQAHGAIGTTREHRLHEVTRAALAWRSEYGSVRHWDQRVAAAVATAGPTGLWPLITGAG